MIKNIFFTLQFLIILLVGGYAIRENITVKKWREINAYDLIIGGNATTSPAALWWSPKENKMRINIEKVCFDKAIEGSNFYMSAPREIIEWTGSNPCELLKK